MTTKMLEDGLHQDVDFDTYTELDAVNQSLLNVFRKTPAHVYHEMTHGGRKPTKALDFGQHVHSAVLEPERFKAETVIPPKVDRRTKLGKETWAQFGAEHAGKTFVDADSMAKIEAMSAAIMSNETAAEFFTGAGTNEASILWTEAGTRCKSRIDRISQVGEWPIIGDLKSTRDASKPAFERSIHNFGYHVQAAHILAGLEALFPVPDGQPFRRYLIFAVESEAPYCCAVYEIDDSALDEGRKLRDRYLKQWRNCKASGIWPGYGDKPELITLPGWAFRGDE